MPARDAARAELAAQRRARLYPERHQIDGTVVAMYGGSIIDIDTGAGRDQLRSTLEDLIGRRVRVTIVVLPEGAPDGD